MAGFFRNKDKQGASKGKAQLPSSKKYNNKKDEETDESDSYGYYGQWDARDYDSYDGTSDSGYEHHQNAELTVAEAALSRLDSTLFYNDYSTLGTGDESAMSSIDYEENRKKLQKAVDNKPLSDVATESFRAMSLSGSLVAEALGLDGIMSAPDCMNNPEKNLVDSTKVVPAKGNGQKLAKNSKGVIVIDDEDDGPSNPCSMCSPMRLCGTGALLDDTLDESTGPTNTKKTGNTKSRYPVVRGQKIIVRPQTLPMSGRNCVTKALIPPRKSKKQPASQRKFLGGIFNKKQPAEATKKPVTKPMKKPNTITSNINRGTRNKRGSIRHDSGPDILNKTEELRVTATESIHTIRVGISQ